MSENQNIAKKVLLTIQAAGEISERESKNLLEHLMQEDGFRSIESLGCEDDIARELLRLSTELEFKLVIPPRTLQDDLSSPLDTFLLSKKKQAAKNSAYPNDTAGFLIKIDE
jgi:hypothetical protein